MNRYVDNTLIPGEQIICSAHYHWFYWAKRALFYTAILAVGYGLGRVCGHPLLVLGVAAFVCLAEFAYALMLYCNDEMVITNHRVVLKTGIFSRYVFEMQISKVETVLVDQSIPGRIFNFGTIACRGTGGTSSKSIEIEAPLEFRAAFQNAVKESQQTPLSSSIASSVSNTDKLDEIIRLLTEINQKLNN